MTRRGGRGWLQGNRGVVLRNSAVYVLATGLTKGWIVLFVPFLTRFFGAEEFGKFGIALVIVGVLAVIIGFNPFLFVIARFTRTPKESLASYIYHILWISAASGLVAIAVLAPLRGVWQRYGITTPVLIVLVVVALNRVILTVALSVLQMEKRATRYLAVSVFTVASTLVALGILAGIGEMKWTTFFVAEFGAGSLVAVLLVRGLKRQGYLKTGLRWPVARDILDFSVPLVPHALAFWTINSVNRFFLAEMLGMRAVGLYSAAYTLAFGMSLLHESLQRAWQPFFFEFLHKGEERMKRAIVQYTWCYYIGSLVLFAVYVQLTRLFLPILVGSDFQDSMEFIPLLVLAYTVLGMYRVVAGYLYQDNRTKTLAAVTILAAVVNVALNLVLIPMNGAVGAAQATLGAFVFAFIMIKVIVIRGYDMPWISALRPAQQIS